jgi:hypothetical protein
MSFLLRTVTHERLKDSKERLISTVTASYLSELAQQEMTKVARSDEDLLLKAMSDTPGASISDLAQQLGWYTAAGKPYRSKVQRIMARLKQFKLITRERDGFTLTEKGRKAVEKGQPK